MQDYLEYIYPMVPIVHRPSFRKALQEDQDREDDGFLALILSIAALVVATMRSRFQAYQSDPYCLRFSSRKEFIHFCYQKVMGLRTSSYFDELNFQKFAVPYLFFAAYLQLGDHNWSRMLSVEAMQIARLLNLHRISDYDGLNCIETQLRKKGFWLMFYGFVHAQLQNLLGERLTYLDPVLLHSINPEDLMPLGVDDEFIFEHEVLPAANIETCLVSGFIFHSRVFWAAIRSPNPNAAADDPCACIRAKDPGAQVSYFQERLNCLQNLLIDIPSFLQPWESNPENFNEGVVDENTKAIRLQLSSIRANLHVTHLWLQSLILDQLEAAQSHQQAQPSATSTGHQPAALDQRLLWVEREKLCRQLFFILFNFPRLSLEANGLHIANKVRDIMTSLLACPFHPDDPISKQAAEYVQLSTDILSRLDSSEGMNTMHLQTWVDTDRIQT
ncbi:Transcription factor, fungi [Penicillium expansum]|nr:Transcription factor, fungi [Penicillium expansum]KGO45913.1 Transcription factor, fungi [Penicillium expansum]